MKTTCPGGVLAMSSASRKLSASGLRICTKQEEIKEVDEPVQLELTDSQCIQFPRFVTDYGDLRPSRILSWTTSAIMAG